MAFRYNPLTGAFDIVTGTGQEAGDISELQNQLQDLIDSIGEAEGIASLDESGKVPSSQLPSYVDDVIEAADFASLPLIGETGKIYVTLDTNLTYRWSGSAYIQVSESPVLSVNGKIGEVVLDKSDVGLDQVDNTSDADKPVSIATQDELDFLDGRIVPIEDRAEVLTVYAYENNAQVYADGQPGVKDPSALIRDGWYFKNSLAGQKINWYYFDGTSQGSVTLGELKSSYAVMTFDAVSGAASPIIAIYTFPTGVGDVIPGFAHSRIVYDGPMTPTPVAGKQYLVYAGENPPIRPDLPRINLALIPSLSIGDKLPTEQILTISFGSNSGAAVNQVQHMVETLGLFSNPVKHEMDLRIRVASQLDLDTHVGDTSNPHSVTAAQVGLGNVDNTSDLDKPISTATQEALDSLSASTETQAINFNATTDWELIEDEYVLIVPQTVHLKGINPQVEVYELVGSDLVGVIVYTSINLSGDIKVIVQQTPDNRFAGRLIIS
jgi:hypothetical protein